MKDYSATPIERIPITRRPRSKGGGMADQEALTPTRSLTEEVEELFNEVDKGGKAMVKEGSGSKTTEQAEQVICI